jgi:chromosome segregation ATPase
LGLFGGKKKSRDDIIADGIAQTEAEASGAGQEKKEDSFSSGNAKVDIELTRIKAQLESLNEIRKANSERFSRVSEQMGELRGMIMDTNKTMSKIEVSATKAIDLVESVQPEKLMIEIRKQEGKAEALKANIESNEAMMRDLMEELKKIRQQMNFYKGIEQVVKLNEEVKGEILEIKKVEAVIERHADKSESIFLDLEKKYAEFDKFQRTVDEVEKTFHAMQGDFDNIKLQLSNKAEKKEFGSLMDRFTEFEKHTGNIMKLLDERSKHMKIELKENVKKIKSELRGGRGLMLDEAMVRDEKMPGAESEYLNKIDGVSKIDGLSRIDGIAKRPQMEEKPFEQKEEPKKEAGPSAEPGLGDILKKRRIITNRLSDEEEEKQP